MFYIIYQTILERMMCYIPLHAFDKDLDLIFSANFSFHRLIDMTVNIEL